MKKNDKIMVIFGVVILLIASIGIYYYEYDTNKAGLIDFEDFNKVTGRIAEDL